MHLRVGRRNHWNISPLTSVSCPFSVSPARVGLRRVRFPDRARCLDRRLRPQERRPHPHPERPQGGAHRGQDEERPRRQRHQWQPGEDVLYTELRKKASPNLGCVIPSGRGNTHIYTWLCSWLYINRIQKYAQILCFNKCYICYSYNGLSTIVPLVLWRHVHYEPNTGYKYAVLYIEF